MSSKLKKNPQKFQKKKQKLNQDFLLIQMSEQGREKEIARFIYATDEVLN